MAEPASFPAIRCRVGDWSYFNAVMRFGDIAARIQRANEIHTNQGLDDMIQRELTKRVRDIAVYLQTQHERFFNAIVVGIYGGSPDWLPVDIEDSDEITTLNLTDHARESLGVLRLSGDEQLFAVDGQHRVEGIKIALRGIEGTLDPAPGLADEDIAVLFVGHRVTPDGKARTRRLFTTLNKYAKPVARSEVIALDEDDVCAIVARMVVNQYDGLSKTYRRSRNGRLMTLVKFRGAQMASNDRYSITTVQMLYKMTDILSLSRVNEAERRRLKRYRPVSQVIDRIYNEHISFWEGLRNYVPSMRDALGSNPEERVAARYRHETGGHILFRPVGQESFARATSTLLSRGIPFAESLAALAETQLALDQPPWRSVMWDPSLNAMKRTNIDLAASLLLHMVGQHPVKSDYDLEAQYRTTLGDSSGSLGDVPRSRSLVRS